jgi:hypothetical protein
MELLTLCRHILNAKCVDPIIDQTVLKTGARQDAVHFDESRTKLAVIFCTENFRKCWTKRGLKLYYHDVFSEDLRGFRNYNTPFSGKGAFFAPFARNFHIINGIPLMS